MGNAGSAHGLGMFTFGLVNCEHRQYQSVHEWRHIIHVTDAPPPDAMAALPQTTDEKDVAQVRFWSENSNNKQPVKSDPRLGCTAAKVGGHGTLIDMGSGRCGRGLGVFELSMEIPGPHSAWRQGSQRCLRSPGSREIP